MTATERLKKGIGRKPSKSKLKRIYSFSDFANKTRAETCQNTFPTMGEI